MSTWLITGGAGFIGSNFIQTSIEATDAHIVVLDALTYAGNIKNLESIIKKGRIEFIHGNICDVELIESIFRKFDISKIIHFAAESHVDRSISSPYGFIKTNIEGTFNLINNALKFWKSFTNKLFLHVSTDEVYGALSKLDKAFDEESPYKPNSPYAASKAGSDHLVMAWHNTYGFPAIVSNCSNNYGPFQHPEKFIPLMILNAIKNKPMPIYGDGLQIRDWLHVYDHCDALNKIIMKGNVGNRYAIGGDNEVKNIDLANLICSIVDEVMHRAPGTTQLLITHVKDRLGHDKRYAINSEKIKKELGWKSKRNFESEIYNLVLWYKENIQSLPKNSEILTDKIISMDMEVI